MKAIDNTEGKIHEAHAKLGYEAVGSIIDATKILETKLNLLLFTYLKPPIKRQKFVYEILLSNHFLSLGSKIKLLFYINDQEKWLLKKEKDVFNKHLHYVLKIRNAIAHDFHSSECTHKEGSITDFNYKFKCFNNENYSLETYKGSIQKFYAKYNVALETITKIIKIMEK